MPGQSASSSSGYQLVERVLVPQEPQPMEVDKPEQTRGKSRARSRGGNRSSKTPPADPRQLMEIEDEDQQTPISVQKQISKIERQARAITDQGGGSVPSGSSRTENEPKPAGKKGIPKTEHKSPEKKGIKKDTASLTKERAQSESPQEN